MMCARSAGRMWVGKVTDECAKVSQKVEELLMKKEDRTETPETER